MWSWLSEPIDWFLERLDRYENRLGLEDLARVLETPVRELQQWKCDYREFEIPKRSGGRRRIQAPNASTRAMQRRILRRLLCGLKTHPAATGFQKGLSIVENAMVHQSQNVVIRCDLKHFFPSISAKRVDRYLRRIGWDRKSARCLTGLVTWNRQLPQGAPTSPRISNLVCTRLDRRIAGLALRHGGVYTRYADDVTVSLSEDCDDLHSLIRNLMQIIRSEGFHPHIGKKFDVRRRHQRQKVTGLVVNDRAGLPRETRRWLRAVEHRMRRSAGQGGSPPTLTEEQFRGWKAFQAMIERRRKID